MLSLLTCIFLPKTSFARVYDMYRADYPKGAFCSVIAGACASDPTLANAFFQNPAAITADHKVNWDFDGDYTQSANLEPGMKGSNTVSESQLMGGVAYGFDNWGIGFSFSGRLNSVKSSVSVIDDQDLTRQVGVKTEADTFEFNVPFSRAIDSNLSVGASLFATLYAQGITVADATDSVSNNSGLSFGLSLGVLRQFNSRFRVGSWFRSPVTNYNSIQISDAKSGTTLNYSEDFALHHPWILATGISFMPWEDQRTFFFDLDLIGPTLNGNLLTYDTFSSSLEDLNVRQKGRSMVIEPRLGFRTPWYLDPRGMIHAGTYFETSRWEGFMDRLHVTAGFSYNALSWLELMAGVDVAKDFFQLFLTFR